MLLNDIVRLDGFRLATPKVVDPMATLHDLVAALDFLDLDSSGVEGDAVFPRHAPYGRFPIPQQVLERWIRTAHKTTLSDLVALDQVQRLLGLLLVLPKTKGPVAALWTIDDLPLAAHILELGRAVVDLDTIFSDGWLGYNDRADFLSEVVGIPAILAFVFIIGVMSDTIFQMRCSNKINSSMTIYSQ